MHGSLKLPEPCAKFGVGGAAGLVAYIPVIV